MSNYICPRCGKSDYYELYRTGTLMGWQPHYVNGELINQDPNYYTVVFCCAKCGKEFAASEEKFSRTPRRDIKADRAKYVQEVMTKYQCPVCGYLYFAFADDAECPRCKGKE